jgi:hypothetical protein
MGNNIGSLGVNLNTNYISNNLTYRIINVLNQTVASGTINSINEGIQLVKNSNLQSGLYIYQILENGSVIKQEKLSIGF